MTSQLWQKSDDVQTFFPQPIFDAPPRLEALINVPIAATMPPPDEVELLSWDDIVASEEEAEGFMRRVCDYITPVPIPEDINMRFVVAWELLGQARAIVGTEGIKYYAQWVEHFDREITT